MNEDERPLQRLIEALILCDYAVEYGSNLVVAGAFRNLVVTRELPTLHSFMLVTRLGYSGNRIDTGQVVDIEFRITGPGDRILHGLKAHGTLADGALEHPELTAGLNLITPLTFPVEEPGLHRVQVFLDGHLVSYVDFKVIREL